MAQALKDYAGLRFHRYTVLGRSAPARNGAIRVSCQCDCGTVKEVYLNNLRSGCIKSCGCYHVETSRAQGKSNRKHGWFGTKEYRAWRASIDRCTNPRVRSYPLYGGRGIQVCDRWLASFEAFLEDMGPAPSPEMQIDRIDTNGNYEPGNCRWITSQTNNNNRRNNRRYDFDGRRLTIREALIECQSSNDPELVRRRVKSRRWTLKRAVIEPARPYGVAR